MHIAILDLGTNTFHLLIVRGEASRNGVVLFKEERFVQLAEEGIETIGKAAYARALKQVAAYAAEIGKYPGISVHAFGTAAFRKASNGPALLGEIKDKLDIEVTTISGEEEAGLIYEGVRAAVPLGAETVLIMDIGGGSTEFILANATQIFWKQSFPVGASVLKAAFHLHDPISEPERRAMQHHLEITLSPLLKAVADFPVRWLIGASGSFDTLADLCRYRYHGLSHRTATYSEMFLPRLLEVLQELSEKNLEERLAMEGMQDFRAPMVTAGAVLTRFIIEKMAIQRVFQSEYALKEGVLARLLSKQELS